LGFLWSALEPLLYFSILYVVFSSIRDREEGFAIYLITGVMLYHIFIRGTSGGVVSLTGNHGILKAIQIKKGLLLVVSTIAIAILAFVDVGVFFGLMPVFNFVPSWTIILLPIPIALVILLVLGSSYLLSIANVYARDVQYAWSIFAHSLLFISPIFWKLKDANEILLTLHKINPLGQLIEIAHALVIDKSIPPIEDWLYTGLFVAAILLVGYATFKKFENKIVEKL